MMSKGISVITYAAVLGGLMLGLLSPAAHGHGNNPSPDLGSTGPAEPAPPPFLPWMLDPGRDFGDDGHGGIGDTPDNSFSSPGGPTSGGPGGNDSYGYSLRGLILGDLPPADVVGYDTPGLDSVGIDPNESISSFRPLPAGGPVPSPGTLALLGLAALTVRRRRRR